MTTERTSSRTRRHVSRVVPLRVEGLESRQLLSTATLTLTSAVPAIPTTGNQQVAQNGFLEYDFTISNPATSPGPATITFSDPLPTGVTLLSVMSSAGAISTASNTATVTGIDLKPGDPDVTVTVLATPTAATGATFTNTATITASEGVDTTQNTASLTSIVVAGPTLKVTIQPTPNPLLFTPGSGASPELDYLITVTNTAAATTTPIDLTVDLAQLPDEVTLQNVTVSSPNMTATGDNFPVTITSLAGGATAQLIARTKLHPATTATTLQPLIVAVTQTSGTAPPPPIQASVAATVAPVPVPAPLPAPKVISLNRYGIHRQTTSIVIGFSEPLDPATAQFVDNFHVSLLNQATVPIRSAVYDATHRTVTLNLGQRLTSLAQPIRIAVNGVSPDGVANLAGTRLAGTGSAGTNFVRIIRGRGPGAFGTPVA